jgi:hypothetical protein
MDDQLWTALSLIGEILQSSSFFIFIYGSKAISWSSQIFDSTMNDDGWLMKLALTILIILASLQAIRMAYRGIMWWIRFAFNFMIMIGLIAVMVWLWSRGFDGAWEDLGIVTQFWTEQYHKYESQAKTNKAFYDVLKNTRDAINNERERAERVQGRRLW